MLSLETEVYGLSVNAIKNELTKEYNGVKVFQPMRGEMRIPYQ